MTVLSQTQVISRVIHGVMGRLHPDLLRPEVPHHADANKRWNVRHRAIFSRDEHEALEVACATRVTLFSDRRFFVG